MEKYSEYKASLIPWVNEIPSHWMVAKAKRLWKKEQREVRAEDDIVTAFRDGTVTLRKNRREDGFTVSLKEIGYQGVRKGDLVIHQMDAFAGAIGVSDSDGKCTPVYSVCTPTSNANPYYYNFLLREMSRSKFILSLAKGIRERSTDFRFDMFGELEVPVPPAEEQQAIVFYLKDKLDKIELFINKKKKLIELLREQKKNRIKQLVLEGSNSKAPLKCYSNGWVTKTPSHWEVMKLKYVASLKSGDSITAESIEQTGQYPVYGGNGLRGYTQSYTNEGFHILIGRQGALCGNINYADGKFWASEHAIVLYPKRKMNTHYLGEMLRVANLNRLSQSAAQPGLSIEQIKNELVVVPPYDEQNEISALILNEERRMAFTTSKIEREILITEEFRTALIAEAVTGKIDVRNYASLETKLETVEA